MVATKPRAVSVMSPTSTPKKKDPTATIKKTESKTSAKILDAAKGPDADKPKKDAITPAPKPSKSIESDYADLKAKLKDALTAQRWWQATIKHPEVQRLINDLKFKIVEAKMELEDCAPKDLAGIQATVKVLTLMLTTHLQGRAEGVEVKIIKGQIKEMEIQYPIFVGKKGTSK